jgi:hypothetical protein
MKVVVLLLVIPLVGCAGHHTAGTDSNTGKTELFVPWSIQPSIPNGVTGVGGIVANVDNVTLNILDLRVIGDAGPGDPRTTEPALVLDWSPIGPPDKVEFSSAPAGLYSKVTLSVDGAQIADSYLIAGTVNVAGTTYPFTIHDRFSISVSLDIAIQLDPGKDADVVIQIDLNHCVGAVDWTMVHNDSGVLNLDTDDFWIDTFRQLLLQSFSVKPDL